MIKAYFHKNISAAPLAVFRMLFGLLMLASILRFWANGWIDKLYIQPQFFFSYQGFEWVKPFGVWTYGLFVLAAVSALFVAIGFRYRLAIITFFLSFTYIELMDKTTYLNHYYFVSLMSFLLVFLPANAYYSVDAKLKPRVFQPKIPKWNVDAIKLLLGIVYFYAGLAKLNSDWLLHAMPLKIWLPSKAAIPLIGPLLTEEWMAYAMSWSGAIYDLSIPFLLLFRKTRWLGFVLVVVFHVFTRILFPIGMFPFIMIGSSLIFFSAPFHQSILQKLNGLGRLIGFRTTRKAHTISRKPKFQPVVVGVLALFFMVQIAMPFRFLLEKGELFWHERGYRFSWRVMLIEKAGYAQFTLKDPETGNWFQVDNAEWLTSFQEKQMATQPDFILEYAEYLQEQYSYKWNKHPEVYVSNYVALNGRSSQPYVNPKIDLASGIDRNHPELLLPFGHDIKGL